MRTQPKPPAVAQTAAPTAFELAPTEVFVVQALDLQRRVRVTGSTQAAEQVLVRSQIAATVADVLVREGDRVTKDQIIAKLDTRDLQAQVDQRKATLASTEAQLELAEKDRTAKSTLAKKGWVSRLAMNQVESTYGAAKASADANRAFVEIAKKALQDATIRAPISGTVSKRNIDPGGTVAIGGELFTIVDLTSLEIAAAVPVRDIDLVKAGQAVKLRASVEDKQFEGRIARINPSAESGSQAIIVHIAIPNTDRALRAGVFVSGDIVVGEAPNALAVPVEAIRHAGNDTFVLKIANGTLVRQAVTTGLVSDAHGLVAIRDGLSAGDRVLRVDLPSLQAGRDVTLPSNAS